MCKLNNVTCLSPSDARKESSGGGIGGRHAFLQPLPLLRPALPARPLRAVGGAVRRKPVSRGCLSLPSAPSTRRVLMSTFVSTSAPSTTRNLKLLDFRDRPRVLGGGDVTSPWLSPMPRIGFLLVVLQARCLPVLLRRPAAAFPPVCLRQYFECSFSRLRRVLQW